MRRYILPIAAILLTASCSSAAVSQPATDVTANDPKAPAKSAPAPTFSYPGDSQCAITYKDNGDGSMSWTVTTAVSGELITHADVGGDIYRHDDQADVGVRVYRAPVPLSRVDDIGGTLSADSGHYGCSVAPAR